MYPEKVYNSKLLIHKDARPTITEIYINFIRVSLFKMCSFMRFLSCKCNKKEISVAISSVKTESSGAHLTEKLVVVILMI